MRWCCNNAAIFWLKKMPPGCYICMREIRSAHVWLYSQIHRNLSCCTMGWHKFSSCIQAAKCMWMWFVGEKYKRPDPIYEKQQGVSQCEHQTIAVHWSNASFVQYNTANQSMYLISFFWLCGSIVSLSTMTCTFFYVPVGAETISQLINVRISRKLISSYFKVQLNCLFVCWGLDAVLC